MLKGTCIIKKDNFSLQITFTGYPTYERIKNDISDPIGELAAWLQAEGVYDTQKYTELFMAMWLGIYNDAGNEGQMTFAVSPFTRMIYFTVFDRNTIPVNNNGPLIIFSLAEPLIKEGLVTDWYASYSQGAVYTGRFNASSTFLSSAMYADLKPCPICGTKECLVYSPPGVIKHPLNYRLGCYHCAIYMEHDRPSKLASIWNKRNGMSMTGKFIGRGSCF